MKNLHKYTLIALFALAFLLSACSNDCPTCGSRESGGQVMNPNNSSQQVEGFLSQFYGDAPEWSK